MAFTQVTVTGTCVFSDGGVPAGTVEFTPTAAMSNGNMVVAASVIARLTAGTFSVTLAATDDPATSPTGVAYRVIERITGRYGANGAVTDLATPVERRRRIVVPRTAGVLDLGTISDAVDGPVLTAYDLAGAASSAVAAHAAAADPHPGYLLESAAATTYQPLDSDLTAIAALSPANDNVLQRKSGSWTSRTMAQLKTDLGVATDISTAVAALVNSAPTTLDTLGELATALQADESAAAALATTVASKVASVTAGDISVTIGGTATAPTVKVNHAPVTITYAATITPNAAAGNLFRCTATGDLTLADPTGPTDGQTVDVEILASGADRALTVGGTATTIPSGKWWLGTLRYSSTATGWFLVDERITA